MKKIITTILILSLSVSFSVASDYEVAVRKGMQMLQQSKSAEATHYFERLSEIHKEEWLPLYYAAYGCLNAGIQQETPSAKDEDYKRGLSFIDRAKTLRPNESEILVLEAYLKLMYISNDAMKRAPTQTTDAIEILEKAKALNPHNPRAWFVQGQNTFFTPVFFGGGEKNAKPLLEKAVSLYNAHSPENDLMPQWGEERCANLLEQCQ